MQRTSCCRWGGAKISMTTSGPAFTEDEYKTRTYEDLSSEFQKLYSQVVRAYQLIPQMYNRLTIVDRLSHIEAILKMANDHKHLPGFSDRNVRDTCHHIIQIYLTELGRHGLKIVLLKLLTIHSKVSVNINKMR